MGPALPPLDQRPGLIIAPVDLGADAAGGVLGRAVNRSRTLDGLLVTVVSMGIGATALLGAGVARRRRGAGAPPPRGGRERGRRGPDLPRTRSAPSTVDWTTVANRLDVVGGRRP